MKSYKSPQEVLSNFQDEQFTLLVFKYVDQSLDSGENEELQRRLRENSDCRDAFVAFLLQFQQIKELSKGIGANFDFSDISGFEVLDEFQGDTVEDYDLALKLLSQEESEAPAIVIPKEESKVPLIQKVVYTKQSRHISKLSIYSAVMSAAAVVLIALFVRFAPVKHEESRIVGILSDSINAEWKHVSGNLVIGCDLYAGPMKLESGYAKINMNNGAVVIVQAPSQFILESADQVFLQEGQLVVRIDTDEDTAFMVRSPQATIVDYGTEFGVQVDAFKTMTHVYEGRVELRSGSNPLRYARSLGLTENQGGKADIAGNVNEQQGISGIFVRAEEFAVKQKAVNGSAYHRWLDFSLELRKDPDLVAYYTFERDMATPGSLVNQAISSRGDLNGHLMGANGSKPLWSQGRFSQKNALTFDSSRFQFVEVAPDERLCVSGPITLATWIYCESAEEGGHIISNRTASGSSPCNYQLGYRGKEKERTPYIHMARKLNAEDDKNQINSKKLPDDLIGWILVAATHDNQTLKYYINGELFDVQYWPLKNDPVEAGLRIGSDFRSFEVSGFNGKIDEVVILRRIMSEREIAEMYKAGKP